MSDRAPWRQTADAPFVEAILAAPDDDAPRLVYADVLSQRGDSRGELIVIQCALASAGPQAASRAALEARHTELIEELGRRAPEVQAFLHRGFASKAIITQGGAAQLAQEALYATILELVFWRMPPAGIARVVEDLAAPDVPLLTSLRLSNEIGRPAGAERMARWPLLSRLTALTLLGGDLTLAGLDALLRGTSPPPLENLALYNDALGGLGALLAGPLAPRGLAGLEVAACRLALDDVALLTNTLPQLRRLRLDLNDHGDEHAHAIARGAAPLQSLWLANTRLTGRGAVALAGANALSLEELSLEGCDWSDGGSIAPVLERFDRLATLRAGAYSFGDDAVDALVRSIHPAIRVLDLRLSSGVGPRGAEVIAGAEPLRGLRELSLALVPIGNRGAIALARADLPHLERLDLSSCEMDDAGGNALVEGGLPRGLKIGLSRNAFSEPVRQSLRERFADVTL